MIYTVRTTSGREEIVIDIIMTKVKNEGLGIKAVFHPAELKGYIFIEGKLGDIYKAVQGLLHIKGVIDKPVNLSEIQHFLERKKDKIKIEKEDIVEIIGGPFKGERGKIERIDKVKDEVTVELLEAAIPIPVTISSELVKLVKRHKTEPSETQETEAKKEGSVFDKLGE
ncbi:MAG: transcription elongation factor Spt5 [Candidatus Aenigmatarchaeota archaeon]|nr:MAG: transcription elongation factor Spt5 [Candidatus Aenigmarchaeota archaeon]RLJ07890.1 MAG: transcription elongation factor Spt5 [Candidatus Aenigmarchaeota archaeon]RLJ08010.1 MAG: transcription elongation factor Spt5 [Candidatus Aenigmarchaeota archaeon]